jgi:hypothetical protein
MYARRVLTLSVDAGSDGLSDKMFLPPTPSLHKPNGYGLQDALLKDQEHHNKRTFVAQ